ncbi:MAG: hypothetical protein ACLGI9_14595 [Thermoanaerobaculia bacterium]
MRKLALILALAALLIPGLALAEETPKAPETPDLSLEEILLGSSCATEEVSSWSPPGCAKPCKSDLNCPYYPEQVCLNGCCVF